MASGYYPPGAEYDPNAPYNQSEPPEIPVELTATETMTKTITVYTNKVWRLRIGRLRTQGSMGRGNGLAGNDPQHGTRRDYGAAQGGGGATAEAGGALRRKAQDDSRR